MSFAIAALDCVLLDRAAEAHGPTVHTASVTCRKRAIVSSLVIVVVLGAGCSGGKPNVAEVRTQYAVLDLEDWTPAEAIDYPGLGFATEKYLDWYAEYNRYITVDPSTTEGLGLVLSGHGVGIDEYSRSLPEFEFHREQIGGYGALVGSPKNGVPAMVLLSARDDYTLVLLSHDLTRVEVRDLVSKLREVTKSEWMAGGGKILSCDPLESDCKLPNG